MIHIYIYIYLHAAIQECRLEQVTILDLFKSDESRCQSSFSRNESTFPPPSHVFRTPMRPMSQQLQPEGGWQHGGNPISMRFLLIPSQKVDHRVELEKKFARLFIFVEDYVTHEAKIFKGILIKWKKKKKKEKAKTLNSCSRFNERYESFDKVDSKSH